jgi:hypothetical protein
MKVFAIVSIGSNRELDHHESYLAFFTNVKSALESALEWMSFGNWRTLHIREHKLFSNKESLDHIKSHNKSHSKSHNKPHDKPTLLWKIHEENSIRTYSLHSRHFQQLLLEEKIKESSFYKECLQKKREEYIHFLLTLIKSKHDHDMVYDTFTSATTSEIKENLNRLSKWLISTKSDEDHDDDHQYTREFLQCIELPVEECVQLLTESVRCLS